MQFSAVGRKSIVNHENQVEREQNEKNKGTRGKQKKNKGIDAL